MSDNQTTPFKLRVLHALTDALKEITPGNGYASNLADFNPGDGGPMSRVFRGRPWFGETDPIPMVSVLEHVDEADPFFDGPADGNTEAYDWPILVQGFVNDDAANPTDPAYKLMRDVRRRLVREKLRRSPGSTGRHTTDPLGSLTWNLDGCRVIDLKVSPGKVRPADDVSAKAYFYMVVTLTITENAEEA